MKKYAWPLLLALITGIGISLGDTAKDFVKTLATGRSATPEADARPAVFKPVVEPAKPVNSAPVREWRTEPARPCEGGAASYTNGIIRAKPVCGSP